MRKVFTYLFFPPMALLWLLLPTAAGLLVYSMTVLGAQSWKAVPSYILAAYTLSIWCCRVPKMVAYCRNVKEENKYVQIWQGNLRLRMNVGLFGGLGWNGIYGVFQIGLGIYHHSYWYASLGAYHLFLAGMRFALARYTRRHKPGEDMDTEWRKYRNCAIVLLFMNLVLALMVFFMVYWNRTFHHHQITSIAMAAYTFFSFSMAITNLIKFRKIGSPVCSASKAISLAAACVSMLTLESTMLTAFGAETMDLWTRRILLAATGGGVSVCILSMAVYMILRSNRQRKRSK